jgi:hypothetical protein
MEQVMQEKHTLFRELLKSLGSFQGQLMYCLTAFMVSKVKLVDSNRIWLPEWWSLMTRQ